MELKADISLSALKFFTSESEHICRLCFSSTEQQEVSFEDTVRLQRSYLDETLTFVDMFRELGVSELKERQRASTQALTLISPGHIPTTCVLEK